MYDDKWSVGKNFVILKEDAEVTTNMNNDSFNLFIKNLKQTKSEDINLINNAVKLLEDYRESLNYISKKCKVGALTDIENLINKKLGMWG